MKLFLNLQKVRFAQLFAQIFASEFSLFSIILCTPWKFFYYPFRFDFASIFLRAFQFVTCTVKTFFAICFVSSLRTYQADKFLISLSIRQLLCQKFRIILNIVLIVNEFECCIFFPAAPILQSPPACGCVGFLQFLLLETKEIFASTTKDTWSERQKFRWKRRKNQLCVQWMNGKNEEKIHKRAKVPLLLAVCPPSTLPSSTSTLALLFRSVR